MLEWALLPFAAPPPSPRRGQPCDNGRMQDTLHPPRPNRWPRNVAIALALAVLGLAAGAFLSQGSGPGDGASHVARTLEEARPLRPFRLEFGDQLQLSSEDLRGRWTFLFFGYTHCPDVCPITLSELTRLRDLLAEEPGVLDDTQFIFVSVDPERDPPDALADYTAWFDPSFKGVTGRPEQIAALARQLDIRYRLGEGEEYTVDHSSAILLIDPQVRYHARLEAPHHAQDMRRQFLDIRRRYGDLPS